MLRLASNLSKSAKCTDFVISCLTMKVLFAIKFAYVIWSLLCLCVVLKVYVLKSCSKVFITGTDMDIIVRKHSQTWRLVCRSKTKVPKRFCTKKFVTLSSGKFFTFSVSHICFYSFSTSHWIKFRTVMSKVSCIFMVVRQHISIFHKKKHWLGVE